MDNNMMMLLPMLMSMSGKNGDSQDNGMGNMTEMMLKMLKQDGQSGQPSGQGMDPMMLMMMGMMNNKKKSPSPQNERETGGQNQAQERQNNANGRMGDEEHNRPHERDTSTVYSGQNRKTSKEDFSAIQDFSGRDVMEALQVLMKNSV